MTNKRFFVLIAVFIAIVGASYISAQNGLFQGSVIDNPANQVSFQQTQQAAEQTKGTGTDYTLIKLTAYQPIEATLTSETSTAPESDKETSSQGINSGNIAQNYYANANTYMIRAIISNLGDTLASLPQARITLNDTVISDISGMTKFVGVNKNGLEIQISLPTNSKYLKEKGQNKLTILLDPANQIKETNEQNNSAELVF